MQRILIIEDDPAILLGLEDMMAGEGSRAEILDEIWGICYEGTTRILDQHIANLRKKIEDDPARLKYIVTVHRVGYRFDSPNRADAR